MNWVTIGSGNDLSPVWRQAIIPTNAASFLIGFLGTNFYEIWIRFLPFSLKKMHLKMSSAKWWSFCPGGDELIGCIKKNCGIYSLVCFYSAGTINRDITIYFKCLLSAFQSPVPYIPLYFGRDVLYVCMLPTIYICIFNENQCSHSDDSEHFTILFYVHSNPA